MRPIEELRRLHENQLTREEHDFLFGVGSTDVVLYREIARPDGSKGIVSRTFKAGTKPDDTWRESPADFGVITAPSRDQRGSDEYDDVVAVVPASAAPADASDANKMRRRA